MPYRFEGRRRSRFLIFPFIAIAFVLALSAVLMFIWNRVLVDVLPIKPVSFGQAVAIFIFGRILFGSFRRGGGPPFTRRTNWREKLRNMSEEDRERFRAQWKDRCGR